MCRGEFVEVSSCDLRPYAGPPEYMRSRVLSPAEQEAVFACQGTPDVVD